VKRLILLAVGLFGLRMWLKRRHEQELEPAPSPADDLRATLDETRATADEQTTAAVDTADELRADVHARAKQAIDELS